MVELEHLKKGEEYKLQNRIITVQGISITVSSVNLEDYICITDIARQKNEAEPKDVVKNWMRQKNTLGNILDYGRNFITPI